MADSVKLAKQPSAKSSAKAVPTSRARPAAKTGSVAADPAEPFMRFHHSHDLQTRTEALLAALEAAPDATVHGDALADLVAELTEAGMNYYYLRALKAARSGFVVEQSARLAMSGAVKLISSVSRKFIVRMDHAQLLSVATHIRALST